MSNAFFEQVGKKIEMYLKDRNMTQQLLATELGISKQVLNKIIQGKKAINISEITRIAEKLQVSLDELLQLDNHTIAEPTFSFMGKIKNQSTKDKVLLLKEAIDEILFLEDYSNDCKKTESEI